MPEEGPIIGRDDVLARVAVRLDAGAGGVVLVGDGGIGKSRLAREVVRLARERGWHTVSTVGTRAAAAIPLGALSHLLPDMGTDPGPLLVAAQRALQARAGDRPLIIAVDDAHLLDDPSASLLLQLAMSVRSFVVATIRTGEPAPDAVVALWKDGIAERIEVGRLDDEGIVRLVEAVLGGPADQGLRRVVVERSSGNPLVARELCLGGLDAGAIVRRGAAWSLVGDLPVSTRLAEIVAARLAGLTPRERHALDLLAHGEPLPLSLATRLADREVLVALERRGLVEVRADGRRREVWLSHPAYANVLRTTAGPLLAASLKGALAEALAATGMRRRADLLRVATWQLESGAADVGLLRRAAVATYHAGDMVATARLAAGAWDQEPSADMGLLLATALAFTGRYAEADATFAEAADLATDEATLVRITLVHAAILSTGMERPATAMELLLDLEGRVTDAESRGALQAQRAHLHARAGRAADTLALALPLVERRTDGPVFVAASMAAMIAFEMAGAHDRVIELADAAMTPAERLWAEGGTSVAPEMFRLQAAGARVAMGELDAMPPDAPVPAVVRGVVVNRPVALLAVLHAAIADLLRGRPGSAGARIEALGPTDEDLIAGPAWSLASTCAALTGRVVQATATLARAEARDRSGAIIDPFLDEARAWVRWADGRPADARRGLRAAAEAALAEGRPGMASGLVHLLARMGGARDAAALVARIPDDLPGVLPAARRAHVTALDSGDAQALERVAEAFAGMGATLLAAEAATQAGLAWRRAGVPRRATRLLRMAADHAAACEGARTPGLIAPRDETALLSSRETEIADLAARGLSSARIAERLVVSTRTVDNHLQRVYQKLGITSRAELPAALGAAEPPEGQAHV